MAVVVKTSIHRLVTALRNKLQAALGVSLHTIKVAMSSQAPQFTGDQDFVITIGPVQPIEGFTSGAGRSASVCNRRISVAIRTRASVDTSDTTHALLLSPTVGHFVREEAVLKALHLTFLKDGDDYLVVEPLRLAEGNNESGYSRSETGYSRSENSYYSSESNSQRSFVFSTLPFEVKYIMDVPDGLP